MPAVFTIGGLSLLGYAAVSSVRAGIFEARLSFVVSAAVACLFLGCTVSSKWRRSAIWAALALVLQAAALQMIDAGRSIHFQHYRNLVDVVSSSPLFIVILGGQLVAVAIALYRRRDELQRAVARIGKLRLLILVAGLGLFSASLTPDLLKYVSDLALGTVIQLVALGNVFLAVVSVPSEVMARLEKSFLRLFHAPSNGARSGLDRFVIGTAIATTLVTALLSYFVYQAHPHVPDETQYLFQAKYMAAGQLTVTPPRVPEAFSMYMVPYLDEHWYSIFPPAFPALLAFGLKLGVGWLVNPILAGICIVLSFLFIQELYSKPVARLAILLLALSPWFVFMGMNFMSHMFTLACSLAAALAMLRSITRRSLWLGIVAGLMVGLVSLIRPLDGLLVAALLGLLTLFQTKNWRDRVTLSAALAVGTVVSAALILPYNKAVTGAWLALPLETYYAKYFWSGANSLGFGSNRGMGWGLDAYPGHSPIEALINTALNTFQLNTELLGWGTGSLLFVGFLVLMGGFQRKDAWAYVSVLVVVIGLSLFWYHGGPDFGPRYWFIAVVPLVVLTISGMMKLSDIIRNTDRDLFIDPRVLVAALVLCFASTFSYFTWRASDKYYHYLNMHPGIKELAGQADFRNGLVLVRGSEHPDYQSAWIYNEPNFEGEAPLYAWDKSPQVRQELLDAYPDREVWFVDGPTLTGGGYAIRAGPIKTDSLRR